MPCYKASSLTDGSGVPLIAGAPGGVTIAGRQSYTTEADCLQACKEGACCEGTTCSVKPQCQCQGTGKTFKGVGTTCTPNPCLCCTNGENHPSSLVVEITSVAWVPGTYSLTIPVIGTYVIPFGGCLSYRDLFFRNSQPCAPAAHPCFTGCSHKLDIFVTTGISSFSILFGLADCEATDNGFPSILGGEVWGNIQNLGQFLCGGQSPIVGTTTQRNNPNYGGVLNAISYRITKP
jgi:hypothetical protein